jgi:LysM repeat protein
LPPLPDIKPGDDPAKIAGDFQKAAIAHFAADAVYTVKPGQGWDRVARDTMRKTGEDISNEGKVEQLSDQIAKLNGLSGRLDKSHVLQPGQQVRVRDDAWIKTQVESAMGALAKKVTDAATPGTATAPANTETPDLFSPSRSGEGDVTNPNATAPAAKPDATVPVPATKGDATAAQPATTTASGQPVNPLESSAPPAIPTSTDGTPLPAAAVVGSTNPGDGSVAAATTPGAPPVNADVAAAQATQAQLDAAAAAKQKADQATPAPAATVADSDGLPSPYGNPFDKT